MKERIEKLLRGEEENHILPFFWQHGEDEDTLRRYMRVIHEAHCGAVCVESRPHPDFCGEKWWSDLGCILDEAERLEMKVWVLDDSHFPTGYANGALKEAPPSLCRQNIVFHSFVLCGDVDADLRALGAFKAPERIMSEHEKKARGEQKQRQFDDDEIVCCVARQGEVARSSALRTGRAAALFAVGRGVDAVYLRGDAQFGLSQGVHPHDLSLLLSRTYRCRLRAALCTFFALFRQYVRRIFLRRARARQRLALCAGEYARVGAGLALG